MWSAQETLRLIHADSFRQEKNGQETLQKLVGHVKFVQGETTILCDQAVRRLDSGLFELAGNVRVADSTKTLLADTVLVFEKARKQVALGRVVSVTENDTTTADAITYFEETDKVLSEGNVRIVNPGEFTTLEGETVTYFRDSDFAKIVDGARMLHYDSLWVEQTRIVADTMEIYNGGEETVALNNVSIVKKNTTAKCGYAKYYRKLEKIVLKNSPVIQQQHQQIEGDTVSFFLNDSELTDALVNGNARVVSEADTVEKGRWQNKLTGQSMKFHFQNEEIQTVIIEDQATSIYHIIEGIQYEGVNKLSGDIITVDFQAGKVKRVLVTSKPGAAAGAFSPAK